MRQLANSLDAVDLPQAAARVRLGLDAVAAALARNTRWALASIVAIQWGGVLAVALTSEHNGWLYYHGGDGTWYWSAAWALGHFQLPYTTIGYGLAVLWAPAGAALGGGLLSGLPYIVLLNTLVLLPLVPLLLYGIGERIAGRLFGLFVALTWVAAPIVAYVMFRADYRPRFLDVILPGGVGLNSIGDFPSLVACLAAAWFGVRAMDNRSHVDAALAGLVGGFAIGVKPANALFLPAPALGLLLARRFPQLGAYALGVVPGLVALALWKQRGLGELPILNGTGGPVRLAASQLPVAGLPGLSRYGGIHWGAIQDQLAQIREIFWSKALLEWFAVAGTFGLLRRSFTKGIVIVAWFAAFLLVKGGSEFASVYGTSFFRLLLPAYPAYVLLIAASVWLLVPPAGRPRAIEAVPRPMGRRPAVAAFIVLGLVPMLLTGLAQPAEARKLAQGVGSGVEIPIVSFRPSARLEGRAIRLTWPRQDSTTAAIGYRVFRSANAHDDCALVEPGVPDCYVRARPLANTSAATYLDRPPPGRWFYRVAVTAAYDRNTAAGDPMLLSRPTVVVLH